MEVNSVEYWLTRCNRIVAEELLSNESHGSFIIRPGSSGNQFVLSVKVNHTVQHCVIVNRLGKYGFTEHNCVFVNLDAFLTYYRYNSLVGHNSIMDVKLTRPLILSTTHIDLLRWNKIHNVCSCNQQSSDNEKLSLDTGIGDGRT